MPSVTERLHSLKRRLAGAALAAAWGLAAQAAEPSAAPASAAQDGLPSTQRVEAVTKELRALPDLQTTRIEKRLKLKYEWPQDKPKEKKKDPESDLRWWRDLAQWLNTTARWLMWLIGAFLVAALVVAMRRWAQARAQSTAGPAPLLPSFVRDLDIRPESLPDDIGSAAGALWQRGEQRAALSLLYRGALSRLVHERAVPIRQASTEGECLALAAGRVGTECSAYFGRLVSAWLTAVYGGRMPDTALMQALCSEFNLHLPRSQPVAAQAQPQ